MRGEEMTDAEADLRDVLSLVLAEREARNSALWRTDIESAVARHSEIVEALYELLYGLLDQQSGVKAWVKPVEASSAMKKRLVEHLRASIPSLVRAAMQDFKG